MEPTDPTYSPGFYDPLNAALEFSASVASTSTLSAFVIEEDTMSTVLIEGLVEYDRPPRTR